MANGEAALGTQREALAGEKILPMIQPFPALGAHAGHMVAVLSPHARIPRPTVPMTDITHWPRVLYILW